MLPNQPDYPLEQPIYQPEQYNPYMVEPVQFRWGRRRRRRFYPPYYPPYYYYPYPYYPPYYYPYPYYPYPYYGYGYRPVNAEIEGEVESV